MKSRGFTLVELVIVVAIVAILSVIAVPSYRQYVLRSARVQAKADLMQVAQLLERQFTVDRSYLTYTLDAASSRSPRTGGPARYAISFVARDRTSFSLQAQPLGQQVRDECGTLTVAQTGERGAARNTCW